MIKKLISFVLVLCLFVVGVPVVYAEETDDRIREYYNIECRSPVKSAGDGTEYSFHETDFMILSDSDGSNRKLYVKAEDFVKLTENEYKFSLTPTECALVSANTGHVVRYCFDSDAVLVFFACDDVEYKAPFEALYENGIAWIPYEFSVKLLNMEVVPIDDYLRVSFEKYHPLAVTNLVHSKFRDYAFDPVKEFGFSYDYVALERTEAATVVGLNRLLSFEPTEWAATLLCVVGFSDFYDGKYIEMITNSFVVPTTTEVEKMDQFFVDAVGDGKDIYDSMKDSRETLTDSKKILDNISEAVKDNPGLEKSKSVQSATKMLESGEDFDFLYEFLGKLYDSKELGAVTKTLSVLGEGLKFLEYIHIYQNQNKRAVESLNQYIDDTKYDEKKVFKYYVNSVGQPVAAYIGNLTGGMLQDEVNNGILAALGVGGLYAKGAGIVWSFVSQISPIKAVIDGSEKIVISQYAEKYQDECMGLYYDYYNVCLSENGANEESLDELLNSAYAYLKFSHIARECYAEAYQGYSDVADENDLKVVTFVTAERFRRNNEEIAEMLYYMEQDYFTVTEAKEYAKNPTDEVYINAIIKNGVPVENPVQYTETVMEFTNFPGAKGNIDYISEEEAIDLAERTISKLTGGLLKEDGFLGGMVKEMTGTNELFTYEVLGQYANGKKPAYIVRVGLYDGSELLLFVSMIGNEVWLGVESDTSPGGYYVYTDLDLLHADKGDFIRAIGNLYGEINGLT